MIINYDTLISCRSAAYHIALCYNYCTGIAISVTDNPTMVIASASFRKLFSKFVAIPILINGHIISSGSYGRSRCGGRRYRIYSRFVNLQIVKVQCAVNICAFIRDNEVQTSHFFKAGVVFTLILEQDIVIY